MKILQVHNYYQIAGGEDTVVAAEKQMLESHGHEVVQYLRHNSEIKDFSFFKKIALFNKTAWSKKSKEDFIKVLNSATVDICHVHNFFPLISPSIFEACNELKIPVVLTLHNYRLICTNGLFFRDGKICEDCLGSSANKAINKACYRGSKLQTAAVAKMIEKNKKTWQDDIDTFICLTEFARSKFIQHGLPVEKLKVKPNFLNLDVLSKTQVDPYFVFVGRLTKAKGVEILKRIAPNLQYPIHIIGEGELREDLVDVKNINLLGQLSHKETIQHIRDAKTLLLPSLWYEGMPMTIIEAMSQQTPIIASDLGGIKSMINDGENGFLFTPGSADELQSKIQFVINHPEKSERIALEGYTSYQRYYASEVNYEQLLSIYTSLITHYN